MPNGHAKLAPSSAYRWLTCAGSVELYANVIDAGSSYAEEGTAGHEIFALVLGGADLQSFLGKKVPIKGNPDGVLITQELLDHVEQAIEWVREYKTARPDAACFSEHKYEIGEGNFGLPAGLLWGTADFTAMSKEELCIADLKLGYVDVQVGENEQLIMYALGVLDLTGWIHDQIRLAILQPKTGEPKEVVYTADQMRAFRDAYTPNVMRAAQGGPLVSSEEACRFCKAAGVCPELKKETLALAQREFSSLITLSGEELAEMLEKGAMIENAMKSARAHALKLLEIDPNSVPGWKRVQGEKKRRWKEEDKAIHAFKQSLPLDVIAPRSLVSPLQIEKAFATGLYELAKASGKKVTKAACLEESEKIVAPFAEKPEGFPTLVKDEDRRQALGPVFTAEDVQALNDGLALDKSMRKEIIEKHGVPASKQIVDTEVID
jgi:hypothetical protein